ncbi:MAG TPA: hypothetical protein VGS11_00195 [Candidatus Bathyarchaeia archaeon]|nr:hypothetical protein [Candidatus Bathyarchaeia archaeon]
MGTIIPQYKQIVEAVLSDHKDLIHSTGKRKYVIVKELISTFETSYGTAMTFASILDRRLNPKNPPNSQ